MSSFPFENLVEFIKIFGDYIVSKQLPFYLIGLDFSVWFEFISASLILNPANSTKIFRTFKVIINYERILSEFVLYSVHFEFFKINVLNIFFHLLFVVKLIVERITKHILKKKRIISFFELHQSLNFFSGFFCMSNHGTYRAKETISNTHKYVSFVLCY